MQYYIRELNNLGCTCHKKATHILEGEFYTVGYFCYGCAVEKQNELNTIDQQIRGGAKTKGE